VPFTMPEPGTRESVPFSRTDPAYARQVVEKLVPDADARRGFLELLASLIRETSAWPKNWGVTLHAAEVALNVGGGYYGLWLRSSGLTVYWKGVAAAPPPGTRPAFASVPDTHAAQGPVADVLAWAPTLREQIRELIRVTNEKASVLQGNSRKSHSPGVLRYLEEELEITLPDPVYPAAPTVATFTWIPFFHELTEKVLTYRERQPDLVALLDSLRQSGRMVGLLEDEDAQNQRFPLTVHDPFTFFSHICRAITFDNKRALLSDLRDRWDLDAPVPTDFMGVPEVNNQKAWFFSFAKMRQPGDIDALWDLAEQAVQGPDALTEAAWNGALNVRQVGLAKLTMGLFWLNPESFLALDQNVRAYLAKAGLSVPDRPTLAQYRSLLEAVRAKIGKPFPEISYDAFRGVAPPQQPASPTPAQPRRPKSDTCLNTILYGPPGTGKTYATTRRAVEIIRGTPEPGTARKEITAQYRELEREGRIAFVTFHQSYSYEDFIEGIRPVMGDSEDEGESEGGGSGETPRYECAPGILRRMATRALWALLEPVPAPAPAGTAQPASPPAPSFDRLWRKLLNRIAEDPEREFPVPGGVGTARFRLQATRLQNLEGQNATTKQQHWPYKCSRDRVRPVYEARRPHNIITPQDVREHLGDGAHHGFIATVLTELRKIEEELPTEDADATQTPAALPELTEADRAAIVQRFLRSGEQSGYRLKQNLADAERFVLVIDEINRGNISKILGELIALLEEDKRAGAENEQIVTLPYSRQKFALPPNLYLLGTMNTADKSIALVDVALRRRFEFEELRPDFSEKVCPGLTEPMRAVLTELNRRISLRKDRDYRIGHAFFVRVNDAAGFNRVFRRKIVPLLGEYFYGDWEGLRWVLNEKDGNPGFVRQIPGSDERAARNRWQWYVDDGGDPEAFDALGTLIAQYSIPAQAQ